MLTTDYLTFDSNVFSFRVRHYSNDGDGSVGLRRLGKCRYALDFWNVSLIFEFWGFRK